MSTTHHQLWINAPTCFIFEMAERGDSAASSGSGRGWPRPARIRFQSSLRGQRFRSVVREEILITARAWST
jgi:hypothetical protein